MLGANRKTSRNRNKTIDSVQFSVETCEPAKGGASSFTDTIYEIPLEAIKVVKTKSKTLTKEEIMKEEIDPEMTLVDENEEPEEIEADFECE